MAASTAPASPAAMRCGPAMSASWRRPAGCAATASIRFGAGGERDGFDNRAASLQGRGAAVRRRSASASSATGSRATANMTASIPSPSCAPTRSTRRRTGSRRCAAGPSGDWGGWSARAEASYLDSANRNRLAGAPLNSTFGDRLTLRRARSRGGSAATGSPPRSSMRTEDFRARDTAFFGGTDQDRSRRLTAFVGEWRARMEPGGRHRPRRPPRRLQRLRRRDHLPRRAAGAARRAASASTPPMARASPSRPSTISTASSPARSSAIRS